MSAGKNVLKSLYTPSDMTVGAPWKSIISFTIPMLIGNIAQQLYSTVDSIVVGKYIGDNALAPSPPDPAHAAPS